jgi:hypothetical protein
MKRHCFLLIGLGCLAGQSAYTGSTRHGISSANYGTWGLSYRFVR